MNPATEIFSTWRNNPKMRPLLLLLPFVGTFMASICGQAAAVPVQHKKIAPKVFIVTMVSAV